MFEFEVAAGWDYPLPTPAEFLTIAFLIAVLATVGLLLGLLLERFHVRVKDGMARPLADSMGFSVPVQHAPAIIWRSHDTSRAPRHPSAVHTNRRAPVVRA